MPLANIFRASERCVSMLTGGITALHDGFWLGALDQAALQQLTAARYESDASYGEDAYNLSGLFEWERRVIGEHFSGCRTLLVAAGGGGREAIALARRGFAVDAFECIPRLAESARRLCAAEGLPVRIFAAPPDNVPEGLGEYDGLVAGWGSYVHIRGRERRVRFLGQLRRCVQPGAPLLLSFFFRGRNSGAGRLKHGVASTVAVLRRRGEPVEQGDSVTGGTFQHRFTSAEIHSELAQAGFRVEFYSEMFEGHAVGIAVE